MLKYQVENLDGLPEAVHEFYEQGDDGYTLKVDGVVPKSKFDEVNQSALNARDESKRRRRTVETVLEKLGLDSADGLPDALDALIAKKSGKSDEETQALIAQIRAEGEAKAKAAQDRLTEMAQRAALGGLKASIAEVGFHKQALDMVAQSAMSRIKIDENGNPVIMRTDGTPLAGSGADGHATFADLAKELAAAMPDFLTDTGKGGGGKPPASGGKPNSRTIARSEFNALPAKERARVMGEGVTITD